MSIDMFNDHDFMLNTQTASWLYHNFAEDMPIIDYHCHIDPREIYEDKGYSTITELWLGKGGSFIGDHYKWRLMRACGIEEKYITGREDDELRFYKWAECLEKAIGNPLYHWSHLELKKYFGITEPLSRKTASEIFRECNEKLTAPEMSPRGIILKSNVRLICTTDDPADTLEWHDRIRKDGFEVQILPAFRPDKAKNIEDSGFCAYIERLGKTAGMRVDAFADLKKALRARMDFFKSRGCKVADHALEKLVFDPASDAEIESIFSDRMNGKALSKDDCDKFHTAVMLFLGEEYADLGWSMQLHTGVRRNNNTAKFAIQGADTGYDSIGAPMDPDSVIRYLDALEQKGRLPRTILYSIHPADDPMIDTVIGCFQNEECAGRLQHGSAWWFNDHFEGMTRQLRSIANRGCLGTFVGMLTDSRCLLSYPRHDYFRRILCRMIGEWVEEDMIPRDEELLETLIRDVCYRNAVSYFGFDLPLV